ncbi:PREDICTED: cytokine receptor-like factor 3 [Priapulus caudatus]|uniref:Cytokine receptor-like factor 3 n=1 Tax=Priapulus caudatus TaxID=37621 RepID=A0ABM1DWK7_PRICU|nr:PREDICTED: cytokine receptor-like factor 3 [Priapulus caudatus]
MEFSDIYQGSTVPYRLRNTKPDTPYTFRVAVRAEGEKTWSLWSACHVTMTMLGHYEWETCKRPHYAVSDQNKLASKLSAQTQCIFSRDRTYTCGQLLIFRIVEQGKPHMSDGVGLVVQPRQANEDEEMTINSLMGNGAFCVSSSGQVYINGKEMVTRFPTLTAGMNIMYHTEVLPSVDKVRVSVEVAEKQVTFDWVTDFNRGKLDEKKLFFGACFKYPGWKLSVQ